MTTPNHCEFSAQDFTATAIETSSGRLIHVNGSGLCPTVGWELRLVAANAGVVPHPETLRLELRELPQPRAQRAPTVTAVEAIIEDTRAEEVAIRFSWREGFVIPVRTPKGLRPARRGMRGRSGADSGRYAATLA